VEKEEGLDKELKSLSTSKELENIDKGIYCGSDAKLIKEERLPVGEVKVFSFFLPNPNSSRCWIIAPRHDCTESGRDKS
jgi:hypothetical protein